MVPLTPWKATGAALNKGTELLTLRIYLELTVRNIDNLNTTLHERFCTSLVGSLWNSPLVTHKMEWLVSALYSIITSVFVYTGTIKCVYSRNILKWRTSDTQRWSKDSGFLYSTIFMLTFFLCVASLFFATL